MDPAWLAWVRSTEGILFGRMWRDIGEVPESWRAWIAARLVLRALWLELGGCELCGGTKIGADNRVCKNANPSVHALGLDPTIDADTISRRAVEHYLKDTSEIAPA